MKRRVVITGMGVVSPIGGDVEQVRDNVRHFRYGIDRIAHSDAGDFHVKLTGEVRNLDMEQYFMKHDLKLNDRFTQFTRIAVEQACENSGLQDTEFNRDRSGVIIGSEVGDIPVTEGASQTAESRGLSRIPPYFTSMSLINLAAGSTAIDMDAHGSVSSVVTACMVVANAIGEASHRTHDGYEDVMAVEESEAAVTPVAMVGSVSMRALHEGGGPNRASIPSDVERKDFVMGEGAGVLILGELRHALTKNAEIYGEVIRYGNTCDADHIMAPLTGGARVARAMAMAAENGAIIVVDVDYINTRGTSTSLNDASKALAAEKALGAAAMKLYVSSTKSISGHLLGASGALETITSTLAMKNGSVPATIDHRRVDPVCDLNLIVNEGRQADIRIAMSNSLGLGRHSASILIRRWER